MNISIGYIGNTERLEVRTLTGTEIANQSIPVDDLSSQNLQILFMDEFDYSPIKNVIDSQKKFFPILSSKDFGLEENAFNSLEINEMKNIYSRVLSQWTLNSNLELIENMYATSDHLKNLYQSDRDSFLSELWFITRNTLAATELSFIFNDVKVSENETKQSSLIKGTLSGTKTPDYSEAGEKERILFDAYKNEFNSVLKVTDFNEEQGQLVLTGNIANSPILIMAQTKKYNELQLSILKSLLNALG